MQDREGSMREGGTNVPKVSASASQLTNPFNESRVKAVDGSTS